MGSIPLFNPGYGQANSMVPEINHHATGENWYTAKSVDSSALNVTGCVDLRQLYPTSMCMMVEDIGHAGGVAHVWYWDQDTSQGGSQKINFANSQYVSPRQPWIRAINWQSGDTSNLKLYFTDENKIFA